MHLFCYNEGMPRILQFLQLNSTNAYAKEHAKELENGDVVCAEEQTAGRGRFNRKWISAQGGLYFSVLLKPNNTRHLPNLTQLMALCICQTVRELGAPAQLKWPNDVLVNNQKLSGILSEVVLEQNRFYALVIGVGINIRQADLSQVGQPAVSLEALNIHISRQDMLARLLKRFNARLPKALAEGFASFGEEYKALFPYIGRTVCITAGGGKTAGTVRDISSAGTLLLHTRQGLQEFSIGDMNA